jgi:peptidoglycan/xylan/chitin deacetylase (PgdA/CDA1 family)
MPGRFRSLVLCYHGVSDAWPDEFAVRPSAFEAQLRTLLRLGYRPASAADVLSGRRRLLHVTFDDAYRSVASALPILRGLGVPATIFVCSGYADGGRPLAIPELEAAAAEHPDELETMPWDELRAISTDGVALGSHTVSHAHLTRLSDEELDRELRTSRARLEDEIGHPCDLLAYPFGEHDARVRAAARRAGYRAAFALRAPTRPTDLFAVPRVDLYGRDKVARAIVKASPVRLLPPRVRSVLFPSHSRVQQQP